MRARVPMLSEKDRKKIKKEIQHEIDKEWETREKQINIDLTRRILKTFIYVMNEKYGFGTKRLADLVGDFTSKLDESSKDEVFWEHIDKVVIDGLGLSFERDYTDKGKVVSGK